MSTVVTDGKIIMSDGMTSGGNKEINYYHKKIFKHDDFYYGRVGDTTGAHEEIVDWISTGRTHLKDIAVLVVKPTGIYVYDDDWNNGLKYNQPFVAIGSGGRFALGALYAGATLRQSIKIARQFDPDTGGHIYQIPVRF